MLLALRDRFINPGKCNCNSLKGYKDGSFLEPQNKSIKMSVMRVAHFLSETLPYRLSAAVSPSIYTGLHFLVVSSSEKSKSVTNSIQ